MNKITKMYRVVVDHLTKVLGVLGAGFMSTLAWLDPAVVRDAANTYLGQHATEKIGSFLFSLVILRGWYTGRKSKETPPSQPPQS